MAQKADIIIPVYNAAQELQACLESLQRTVASDQPVIIIDDASTEAEIQPILQSVSKRGRPWRLLRNAHNLGFVRTVNRGMMATPADIVLLNSDTILTAEWLDRMLACAESDAKIATVTPFSNNAEICSFPRFCENNPIPDDPDRVAQAMHDSGAPAYPDIPTAVGFCMYIRRRALNQIGLFDPRFGRGYGEENDFCMRAGQAGWRHVLCDDAYVVHLGERSFRYHGLRPRNDESMARVRARYPDYEAIIADFVARDPLAERRKAIQQQLNQMDSRSPPFGRRRE